MNYSKEFIKKFNELSYGISAWEAWSDMITLFADTLSIAFDPASRAKRVKEAEDIKKKYDREKIVELISILGAAYEENPRQDFLGSIFMYLGLGDHYKGQFFTPYSVAEMMSKLTVTDGKSGKEYETIVDPCCGAGAMLIAAANNISNYKEKALFVGQDIARMTGLMCYIQLSILGCAGYIVIGNSLTNPVCGKSPLLPSQREDQEFWFLPGLQYKIWKERTVAEALKNIA